MNSAIRTFRNISTFTLLPAHVTYATAPPRTTHETFPFQLDGLKWFVWVHSRVTERVCLSCVHVQTLSTATVTPSLLLQTLCRRLLIVPAPDDGWWWVWSSRRNDWRGNRKYSEKSWPNTALSITNPTWPRLRSKPDRRGGKPATGAAFLAVYVSALGLNPELNTKNKPLLACIVTFVLCPSVGILSFWALIRVVQKRTSSSRVLLANRTVGLLAKKLTISACSQETPITPRLESRPVRLSDNASEDL
jgi:hypothetical protein